MKNSARREALLEEAPLLNRAHLQAIRGGMALLSNESRQAIGRAAENTFAFMREQQRRLRDVTEERTRLKGRVASAEVHVERLEKENRKLRRLKGQELHDAIFDSYQRVNEFLVRRAEDAEAELSTMRQRPDVSA